MTSCFLTLALLVAISTTSQAADKVLELIVIAPKEPVELDTSAAKKAVEESKKLKEKAIGRPVAPAAAVPITLRVHNTTEEAVTFNFGADASSYTLTVKGPGVEVVKYPVIMTREFRIGKPVTLEPGKTFDIPLKELEDGMRGKGRLTIITEPGEYTISATYQMATDKGKGPLLTSEPAKFTVIEKK